MGITSEKYGIPHIRLSKEFGDLTDPEVQAQVDYQIEACPRAPNMWGAIPCTAGSVWQRLNSARLGPSLEHTFVDKGRSPRSCLPASPQGPNLFYYEEAQ